QPVGRRADHVGLRVVHVQIDEPWRNQLTLQVLHRHVGKAIPECVVVTEGQDPLNALGIGAGHEQTVALKARLLLLVKRQQGGAVGLFHGLTVAMRSWRCIPLPAWVAYGGWEAARISTAHGW